MSTLEATVDDVSPDVVEYPSSLPILTPIGWFYWTILGIPVIMEHSAPCGIMAELWKRTGKAGICMINDL
jgi:hypothetical protein